MANIVSYNDLIELFEDIARRHYQINTFFLGRDWELENNNDLQYPVLQVYPEVAKMPINNWKEYKTLDLTFNVKVIDLTVPGEENERDVHSDTLRIAQDIVNELNQHPYYIRSNVSLMEDIDFTAIEEFEDDVTAGWQFNLKLRIINANTFCGMPMAELDGVSAAGPTSQGTIVNVQYLTCGTLPACPTIVTIDETLVSLQDQIDNLPPSALTLAQVLLYGNSTGNTSITAGTNLSNILQVSDTVMGLSWNGVIGGNITLDDTGTYVYSDSDVNIESQSTVDITGLSIRLKLDDGFNIARLILNKNQTVSDASTDNNLVILDNISNKGIVYFDDYSANFTDNSLVTKAWVLAQTPAAPSLQAVISVSSVINGFLAQSLDNGTYITLTNSGIDMSSYDGTTTSGLNMYAATGNNLYSDILNSLSAPSTIVTSDQIKLTSSNNNASVSIVSPTGYYYPTLSFINNSATNVGSITGYAGRLYVSPLTVSGTIDMGANKIVNMAPGTNPDDAVTLGQLSSTTVIVTNTAENINLGTALNINYSITALASAITFTTNGTANDFDKLIVRIKDNGTARALTFNPTYFEAKGQALPTTTVAGKVITIGFIFDSVTGKMGCVSVSQQI